MDFSILLLIFLCIWIYSLQSRVKSLEEMIAQMRNEMWASGSYYNAQEVSNNDTTSGTDTIETDNKDEFNQKQQTSVSNLEAFADKYDTEIDSTAYKPQSPHQEQNQEPSWLVSTIANYFTSGNLLVRIGGVVLFFGLAFLVKYIAEHSNVSIGIRLSSVALVGIGLIVGGWKLKDREGAYGQILQGLGVAILYLVLYGAAKFYELLSLNTAFLLMLVVVILGSYLSSTQKSLPLMLFSVTGGFLAPILTSSGDGSHIMLFSYYLLLNLGIFFMAWRYTWRVLNLVGFIFTFVIATTWGILRYSPELLMTTEPFLILFFIMYLVITVLFAQNSTKHTIDSILLFGLPAVTFSLQSQLLSHIEHGAGFSALVMGILYLILSKVVKSKLDNKLLVHSFAGIGVLFITIAIPYFFDADITAVIWSMESAGTIWLSLRQNRKIGRFFGEILLILSTLIYLLDNYAQVITASSFIGFMIITSTLFFAGYQLHKNRANLTLDAMLPEVFLALSFFIWMTSVYLVSETFEQYTLSYKLVIGFILGTMLLHIADKLLVWKIIGKALQFTLPIGAAIFLLSPSIIYRLDPFIGIGLLTFCVLVGWSFFILFYYDKKWEYASHLHIGTLWFAVGMLSLGFRTLALEHNLSQTMIYLAVVLVPLIGTYLLLQAPIYRLTLKQYEAIYKKEGVGGLVVFLALWMLAAIQLSADGMPLPYIPLLNLLDMAQIAILYILYIWLSKHYSQMITANSIFALMAVLISVIFARAVHHYVGIPYTINGLWNSLYFQTGLSILWSAIAFTLMFISKRYSSRPFWFAAFGLLIVVVLKLFFVELANSGTIERIVSFIGVGSLLLAVGYFVPLPPEKKEDSKREEE